MSKSLVELMWDLPEGKVATPRSVFTSLPEGHRLPIVLSAEELEALMGLREQLPLAALRTAGISEGLVDRAHP